MFDLSFSFQYVSLVLIRYEHRERSSRDLEEIALLGELDL